MSLREPTPEERESLNRLLGKRLKGRSLTLKISDLRGVLDAFGIPLELLLEKCFGPLRDEARERAEQRYNQGLEGLIRDEGRDFVRSWLEELRNSGLPKALTADREEAWDLVRQAHRIAARLPAEGITLAELATQFTGDAHALDRGQPLGTLVLRFAAALAGATDTGTALRRRMAWLRAGVLVDEVSSTVLTYNLSACSAGFPAQLIELHRDHSEPCRVCLRHLVGYEVGFAPSSVYLCENPTVLSVAADKLGRHCPPLVCTEGVPSSTAIYLLDLLTESGCTLFYHGDFDWGGLKIANLLRERFPALRMWRMSVSDYDRLDKGRPLRGSPVKASWDESLTARMVERGLAFHEEGHLGDLLADLEATTTRFR